MNRRLTTILLCAFVVAAGASYLVYRLVRQQVGGGAGRRVNVVVAAGDLQLGTLIKATDLKTGALLGDAPKDAVLKPELAVGRGVISPIYAGEPLNEKRLAVAGSGGGVGSTTPPGMGGGGARGG